MEAEPLEKEVEEAPPETPEEEPQKTEEEPEHPGFQKRINQLTGKLSKAESRLERARREAEEFKTKLAEHEARLQKLSEPPEPPPGPDASPEEWAAYSDRRVEKLQTEFSAKQVEERLSMQREIQRGVNPDFDDLMDKYEGRIVADPVLANQVRTSNNPPAEFVKIARAFQAKENGDKTEAEEEYENAADRSTVPKTNRGGPKTGSNEAMRAEWEAAKSNPMTSRAWEGKKFEDFVKARKQGDKIRELRFGGGNV